MLWFGGELDIEPLNLLLYVIYCMRTKASTEWLWLGELLYLKYETREQRNPSYSLTMCLLMMCLERNRLPKLQLLQNPHLPTTLVEIEKTCGINIISVLIMMNIQENHSKRDIYSKICFHAILIRTFIIRVQDTWYKSTITYNSYFIFKE